MNTKWQQLVVLVVLVLVLHPGTGHALLVTVDSATVNVSDTFSINVNVADVLDLTSWQFDLSYNPTLLQANMVTEGSFLSGFGTTFFIPGVIDNTTGLISLVAGSFVDLPPNPHGSGVLASIEFTALQAGTSPLTASNVFLNGLDSGFSVTPGSVTPVPLPGTAGLMGFGILLWGISRWRSQTSVTT